MPSWNEQWVSSDGYARAMDYAQRRHGEFWERHHKIMAELDTEQEKLDYLMDRAWIIPVVVGCALFITVLIGGIFF